MKAKLPIALEREEQQALVEWLYLHPILKNFFLKIDNEGKRTALQGSRLKNLGLRPGASDLFIYYPSQSGIYSGLWLEVKRNKKYTPSEMSSVTWKNQEEFQRTVKMVGFDAKFCYGFIDATRIISCYLRS